MLAHLVEHQSKFSHLEARVGALEESGIIPASSVSSMNAEAGGESATQPNGLSRDSAKSSFMTIFAKTENGRARDNSATQGRFRQSPILKHMRKLLCTSRIAA